MPGKYEIAVNQLISLSLLYCSGLGKLALTNQQAKLKQLKRFQLVMSQTYQTAHLMAHRQDKEVQEEARLSAVQERQNHNKAERMAREASAEVCTALCLDTRMTTPHKSKMAK